ncbi:GNAT family N-acetyltransferase [Phenylobacterium sp.]|uniref:GNAT family N-acetyltransferase n=1 Tax=Phenylobacterium sp. TaxID=1871053 RepID=UPI002EDBAC05
MLSDGFHDVPPGKAAAIVTGLQMFAAPALRPEVESPEWTLRRIEAPTREEYLALYTAVGHDWMWFSRLQMPAAELLAIVQDPKVEVYRLEAPGGETGMLELDFAEPETCELAFFGVTKGLVGGGAARWLMNRAIRRAWSQPIKRFWVHTCTFDHQNAVQFYIRSGFTPFYREVEVIDDPRLKGLVPLDAAPHIPVIRSA